MSYEENLSCISLPAAASVAASQYRFMIMGTTGVQRNTVSGGNCIGVNQGKEAVVGAPVQTAIGGVTKIVLGATVAKGAKVMSDITGRAITATGDGAHVLGICVDGGVVDKVGAIVFSPNGTLDVDV